MLLSVNSKYPEEVSLRTYKPTVKGHTVQIQKVVRELSKAKRPIICVGGGVQLSGAEEELRTFVEKHRVPVVSTMMGISAMPTRHPMYYGMVGNNGHPYANRASERVGFAYHGRRQSGGQGCEPAGSDHRE